MGDRERKSWREIDKARDGSAQRRDEPRPSNPRPGRSQVSYRAALDRAFESGKIGKIVQEHLAPAEQQEDAGWDARAALLGQIRDAVDRPKIVSAVDAYLKQYDLPDDAEVLGQVLQYPSPALQLEAMECLLRVVETAPPRRARTIVAQLKIIRDTSGDPELETMARTLIEKLGG